MISIDDKTADWKKVQLCSVAVLTVLDFSFSIFVIREMHVKIRIGDIHIILCIPRFSRIGSVAVAFHGFPQFPETKLDSKVVQ